MVSIQMQLLSVLDTAHHCLYPILILAFAFLYITVLCYAGVPLKKILELSK